MHQTGQSCLPACSEYGLQQESHGNGRPDVCTPPARPCRHALLDHEEILGYEKQPIFCVDGSALAEQIARRAFSAQLDAVQDMHMDQS